MTPVTHGHAMLVPVMATHRSSAPANPFAAMISVPGAATSGLKRPSRVGPWLLEILMVPSASSRLATDTIRSPQARELTEESSTFDLSEKNDGNRHMLFGPSGPIS